MSRTALQSKHSDRQRAYVWLLTFVALLTASATFISSCGGSGPGATTGTPPPEIVVAVSPLSASVLLGNTQQFAASVTGTSNTAVTWSVSGTTVGSGKAGSISSSGLYTAPQDLPSPASVTVTATSQAGATNSASASVTITSDLALSIQASPSANSLPPETTLQLTAAVSSQGHPDNTVTWSVSGTPNGNTTIGTIAVTGANTATYTAPAAAPNPNIVTILATSVADPTKSASAQLTIAPERIDFSSLPDNIQTNLGTFLVSGSAHVGDTVTVNGTSATLDSMGNFAVPSPLTVGANRIELDIQSSQNGNSSFVKTINFDSTLSTATRRMLYVSSVNANLSGTIVIDVDDNVFLGFIENKHVRGISPDGKQLYMDDLSVFSTATNQELPPPSSPLAFSQPIPSDGFLVSPDGTQLYSRDEVLDLATNQLLANKLPASIETGDSYAGPNQGGPAISPDGKTILCGPQCAYNAPGGLGEFIGSLDTVANSIVSTGIQPSGVYLSDIAVTPDEKYILISSYANIVGDGDLFDANSHEKLGSVQFGDFAGQVAVSPDGTKAVFGSAGNPAFQGGGVTVVDLPSFKVDAQFTIDLADHLVTSNRNELFVSSGDTPGVDEFALQMNGTLVPLRQFVLGINQFVLASGAPQNDDIEKIVLKQ